MTMYNLESWHHDVSHLPGLLHVLSGGLCYHAMLATTVISSPWVGVHLDETVLNSDRITPEKDQRSNAINIVYIYIHRKPSNFPCFCYFRTSGCWFLFWLWDINWSHTGRGFGASPKWFHHDLRYTRFTIMEYTPEVWWLEDKPFCIGFWLLFRRVFKEDKPPEVREGVQGNTLST